MKNLRAIIERLINEGQTELATELDSALHKDLSAEVMGTETTTVNCLGSVFVPTGNYRLELRSLRAMLLTSFYEVDTIWPDGCRRSYGFHSEGKARHFLKKAVRELSQKESTA